MPPPHRQRSLSAKSPPRRRQPPPRKQPRGAAQRDYLRPEEVDAMVQAARKAGRHPVRDAARACSHFSGQASSKPRCEVAIRFNRFHRPAL